METHKQKGEPKRPSNETKRKQEREKQDNKKAVSLKTEKKGAFKQVFDSPFAVHWPNLSEDNRNIILGQLTSDLAKFVQLPPRKSKKAGVINSYAKEDRKNLPEEKRRKLPGSLCFGINQVTKALEKDKLRLVLFNSPG
jgi:hypothetical protein